MVDQQEKGEDKAGETQNLEYHQIPATHWRKGILLVSVNGHAYPEDGEDNLWVQCDYRVWYHVECTNIDPEEYDHLSMSLSLGFVTTVHCIKLCFDCLRSV